MAEKRETTLHEGEDDKIERSEQLAREALGYWQTALRGLLALPNATALSLSSAMLYTTGVVEHAYKRLEGLTERIGSEVTRELGDARRTGALPDAERAKRQPTA